MKEKKVILALSALAQESRLAVFRLLMQGDEAGMPAGDIARTLDIPATTLSFHLSQLRNAGFIEARKEGRLVIYTASRKRVKKLTNYLLGKTSPQEEQDEETLENYSI